MLTASAQLAKHLLVLLKAVQRFQLSKLVVTGHHSSDLFKIGRERLDV